ncbi:MAG TPA: hypothetical protein VFQ53_02525 [Kofleriaceae bacterium]|nr:hypothetical protein [Kofleriaceae bacterium]
MPSITYWNRLEPRPRDPDIRESLAARVRDPLWFLTRQWQLGELRAEDAGSVAFATIRAREARFTAWGEPAHPLGPHDVLAAEALAEPFAVDLALRVELGQELEHIVREHAADPDAALAMLRQAFPIEVGDDEPALRALWSGRVIDGVAAARATSVPTGAPSGAAAWLQALRDHVARTYGHLASADPDTWRPELLEYRFDTATEEAAFATHPDRRGDIDWYGFETRRRGAQVPATVTQDIIPARAVFRGMPNARFWQFESGAFVPGDVRPDKRDLASLILIDYALVHANDWYVVPFEQTVGSICAIDELVIHDTFGDTHSVRRADEQAGTARQRWSMFSIVDEASRELAPWFVVPPAGAHAIHERVIEDVRFFRDEMANMVWAVEHTLANSLGVPTSGHERAMREQREAPRAPGLLRYEIQSDVPSHWIPFVPVVIDDQLRAIALERAAMLRTTPGAPAEPILPRGRILNPTGVATFRVREEEVPREGTRITRTVRRTRTSDGGTRLWISRGRSVGAGEGASQLTFDLAR